MRNLFLALGAAVLVSGCHNDEQPVASSNVTQPAVPAAGAGTSAPAAATPPVTTPAANPPATAPSQPPTAAPTPTPMVGQPKKPNALTPEQQAVVEQQQQMSSEVAKQMIEKAKNTPKRTIAIPDATTEGWHKSPLSAQQIASKVAAATSGMHNTSGHNFVLVETPEGHGEYEGTLSVQDQKRFKIDYVAVQRMPQKSVVVANGTKKMVKVGDKWIPPVSIGKPLPVASTSTQGMMQTWDADFSRLIYQGLTDRADPWVPLVSQWSKGADGYKLATEERIIQSNGKKVVDYRLKAVRSPQAAKKLGESSYEIVIDGKRFLPVTIREVRKDPKGQQWKVQWMGGYSFNKSFAQSEFEAPYNMKPTPQARS